ncbi:acyltransferase family protein [Sphingomonas sp. ZT3P38]|uniref:acyltransferase family protein n=1 Tax=Parasphingomonas zepuensis TaxID=3096161 RepID=UPI002FCA9226
MKAGQSGSELGYVAAIDGLRAIAVVSVIFYHLWPGVLPGGFTGVDIFFVISGFVVTESLKNRHADSLGQLLLYFYARRLLRIMPALIVMLLVTIFAMQLFVPSTWLNHSALLTAEAAFFGLSNVVLALDSDTYFATQASFNFFTHSWSLGVEEQFYFLFPFLLFLQLRTPQPSWRLPGALLPVAVLTAVSLVLAAMLSAFSPKLAFYLIVSRFWELGVGMLLSLTLAAWRPRVAAFGQSGQAVLLFASMLLMAAGLALPVTRGFPFPLALLPVLGAAGVIVTVCALPMSRPARWLSRGGPVWIGRLSYSLYLWHWPVFVFFRWTIGLSGLLEQLAALTIAVVAAMASYRFIEQPFRRHRRVTAMPRGRVVGSAVCSILAASAVGLLLFAAHDRISLSVTRDHALWYAEHDRPLDAMASHCTLKEQETGIGGGTVRSWTPDVCGTRRAGFAIYAFGDSHNVAYAPAYRQLAGELGAPVRAYSLNACPFLTPNSRGPVSGERCTLFHAAVLDDLQSRLRPGDVVFMPGLRLTRFVGQFGAVDFPGGRPGDAVWPEVRADVRGKLSNLSRTGVRFIFEAPKPIFRVPAFRCADWFNRTNPDCSAGFAIAKPELERLRLPVRSAMVDLAAEIPALSVWDPFPVLCPSDPCRALDHRGRPQVFDGDHLSGHGNDILYASLRDAILDRANGGGVSTVSSSAVLDEGRPKKIQVR